VRTDIDIRRDVEDEVRWDPEIDATDIAVTLNSGVVTPAVSFPVTYRNSRQKSTQSV
jgi:hypothetical protein